MYNFFPIISYSKTNSFFLFSDSGILTEIEENRKGNLENVYFERRKKMLKICQKYNLTGMKPERKSNDMFHYILCFNELNVNI